jgi:hypothetical protein
VARSGQYTNDSVADSELFKKPWFASQRKTAQFGQSCQGPPRAVISA